MTSCSRQICGRHRGQVETKLQLSECRAAFLNWCLEAQQWVAELFVARLTEFLNLYSYGKISDMYFCKISFNFKISIYRFIRVQLLSHRIPKICDVTSVSRQLLQTQKGIKLSCGSIPASNSEPMGAILALCIQSSCRSTN